MMVPTMGSLFSGIGGFEIAAQWNGAKVLWQSEIEPWAVQLLETRFPNARQLGSVTDIDGAEIEPVDIITFGSPCQDMSVAGKRAGLDGERSGLFRQAMRIIREMREATNGEYPKYIIWENVPGAFTSNKGNDFRTVLEEITETEIPMPDSGRWAATGVVRGGKCDVSWRTLDAQYWGVLQRRKRIYLVADYRAKRSAEILFKPESVSRYPAPCGESRKGATSDIKSGTGTTGDGVSDDVCYTLTAFDVHGVCAPIAILNDQGGDDIPRTFIPAIMLESHPNDSRIKVDESGQCQTLTGQMGTGGGNVPLVMIPVYTLDCRNIKANEGVSGTLQVNGSSLNSQNPVYIPVAVFQGQASPSAELSYSENISPTIQCTKQADVLTLALAELTYIVRRLTPSECAKLQGFPADWHEGVINEKGRQMPDSAAYKGYGNAVATVCAEYPLANIIEILKEAEEWT